MGALPLLGRAAETATLNAALTAAEQGGGSTLFVIGEPGVGKTRLATAAAEEAERRGFTVAFGRAYPVESGVPYAVFSDALVPVLRALDQSLLSLLARGATAELLQLLPALGPADRAPTPPRGEPAELKARVLWNFAQFLGRFAARRPLLLVLDNLQWADRSSIELLHFVARQIAASRIVIVATWIDADAPPGTPLYELRTSLERLGAARTLALDALDEATLGELVATSFGVPLERVAPLAARLHERTRGNPFFAEQILKSLVDSGQLHERGGAWSGWEAAELTLPASVRDAVRSRLATLSTDARALAEHAAVLGTRATHDALVAVTSLDPEGAANAADELRRARVLVERDDEDGDIVYDFAHPLLRETLYDDLGLARARQLHAHAAEAMEAFYGSDALEHADVLAYHYSRGDARRLTSKAVRYLHAAGSDALARHANREAADYLAAALRLAERAGTEGEALPSDVVDAIVSALARVRQRLGDYDGALALWERALARARDGGAPGAVASIERRMGLARFWSGRHADALAHYERAVRAAQEAGDGALEARILLAEGTCLQALGRRDEGAAAVQRALELARASGDEALLARVHRALLLLYVWTGPATAAREHGARAIELAERVDDRGVAWSAHWALAMLAGLTGEAPAVARHLAEARRLAEELRSPLLRVWVAEVAIEYAAGTGDWDEGVALAERTIEMARGLGQRTLLPRLLVWLGLLYLGRGDVDRGKACVDEAWALTHAGPDAGASTDVHVVVPAHTGRAAYHLTMGEHARAISVGEHGLAIADRSGYVVWAVHRLLPVVAEAALWAADLERAKRLGARLRRDSERLGHRLGLAWADACDALVELLEGDKHRAVSLLRNAAERLEAIPFVPDAARVRRQLARALIETGDREEATRELRRAHDVFAHLGAERELAATREQLRALGARPPVKSLATGAAGLTGREIEIVRFVAQRRSNKEIGTALDISSRTVSTHLSNIFAKLGVKSRGELTDFARRAGIAAE